MQSHLHMSEAKAFRFTDHYNWKYLKYFIWKLLPSEFCISFLMACVLWSYSKLWKCYLSFGDTDSEFIFFFNTKQNKFLPSHCCIVLYRRPCNKLNNEWTVDSFTCNLLAFLAGKNIRKGQFLFLVSLIIKKRWQ